MIEKIQVFYLIINTMLVFSTLLILVIKPIRNKIFFINKGKADRERELEDRQETDRCLLRKGIMDIYNHYEFTKSIKLYDFENITLMYTQYKKLGGNSFIDKVFEEVNNKWVVEK